MKISFNGKTVKYLIIVLAVIIALVALYMGMYALEQRAKAQDDSIYYDYGKNENVSGNVIYVDGQAYMQKPRTETVLVLGIDKYIEFANAVEGSKNTQQADFIALLVMDNDAGSVSVLMLNRDTMCDVGTLTVDGKDGGTDNMQLALAHTYGSGGADSCENTVKTVQNLLGGTVIDHYVSFTMDAVPVINDLCGGVTLQCSDDFGDDTVFKKGSVITLKGTDALRYVRGRGEIYGDPTNTNRMNRQRQYLEALYNAALVKAKTDESFTLNAARQSADYTVSDLTVNQLTLYIDRLYKYAFAGIYQLPGEADYSGEYVRFYLDGEAAQEMVLELLYDPIEE